MGDGADLSEEPPPAPLPPAPRRAGKRPEAQEQHSGRAWEAGPVHQGRETDHAEGAAASGPPGSSQPGAVPQEVPRGPSRRPPLPVFLRSPCRASVPQMEATRHRHATDTGTGRQGGLHRESRGHPARGAAPVRSGAGPRGPRRLAARPALRVACPEGV